MYAFRHKHFCIFYMIKIHNNFSYDMVQTRSLMLEQNSTSNKAADQRKYSSIADDKIYKDKSSSLLLKKQV
jgi:hypothetical protein